MKKYTYITTYLAWQRTYDTLRTQRSVAVDLESNGLHAYQERVCLLQCATRDTIYIIEPDALGAADELRELMATPAVEKLFHSCDYDMRSLNRDYAIRVRGIFDTAIAAQFIGINRLGLDNVLRDCLAIEIPKSKKLQKMDWGSRPLPDDAMHYAANDVAHLHRLRDYLMSELEKKGRITWVREECRRMESIAATPPQSSEDASLFVKGTGSLTPRQRALFRALYAARDTIAASVDLPPFKVIGNSALIALAQDADHSQRNLYKNHSWLQKKALKPLYDALQQGKNDPPVKQPYTSPPPALTHKAALRYKALKQWRSDVGESLGLDPAIIWPMRSLERMAREPEKREYELYSPDTEDVRAWQQHEFSDTINTLTLWDTYNE